MKKLIYITIFFFPLLIFSQVGINTTNPVEMLEVNGNFKIINNNSEIFLENPGTFTGSSLNSQILVRDKLDNKIKRFDPAVAAYASINYLNYTFTNVPLGGLTNYDTKISSTDYYVLIGGYFVEASNGLSANITVSGGTGNAYVPFYNARAFVQNGTWRLVFDPNHNRAFEDGANTIVRVVLNVSVYRRRFLSDINNTITIDMNANTTGIRTATGTSEIPQNL